MAKHSLLSVRATYNYSPISYMFQQLTAISRVQHRYLKPNNASNIYRCPRRNVKYFGRVYLMLNYTDITQNTCIQS